MMTIVKIEVEAHYRAINLANLIGLANFYKTKRAFMENLKFYFRATTNTVAL